MRRAQLTSAIVIFLLLISGVAIASDINFIGEGGFAVGGIFPQGNYTLFANKGIEAYARGSAHLANLQFLSLWFDGGGAYFDYEKKDVDINVDNMTLPGEKEYQEYAFFLHLGPQIGSSSRHGFFRPRGALTLGFYIFNTRTSFKVDGQDVDFYSNNNTIGRFGWRGIIGADFFFSPKYALSLDFAYDQVLHMDHIIDVTQDGLTSVTRQSGRFQGFCIGIVVAFDVDKDEN